MSTFEERYAEMDYGCSYTKNLPMLLKTLNISLAFTSYQGSRLMLVRSDGKTLDVNFKSFQRPMGLSVSDQGITLGIFTQVLHFQREDGLLEKIKQPLERIERDITAPRVKKMEDEDTGEAKEKEASEYDESLYEPVDERVDACFITRSAHYSGMINIHDVGWGDEGLWAVNSSFSCLCTLEPDYSFVPRWKPYFISELVPEDRCHLNGMALKDGKPAYVTTFSVCDEKGMWRNGSQVDSEFNGTLMDVASNTILLDGLAMPHSPRCYEDDVYYCNSGHGQFCRYSPDTKKSEVVAEVQGFTRGVDFFGPIAFVGLSRVRQTEVAKPVPLTKKYDETFSGIWLINLKDGSVAGYIKFTGNVDQIYDVAVIPSSSFPELIEPTHPRMRNHFSIPMLSDLK